MNVVLLLSIALLLLGAVGSVVLVVRSGETRVGWLTLAFFLLALQLVFGLVPKWGAPLAWDAQTFGALSGLAASGLCLLVLSAVWRTLGERDRVEALHWNSMEAVRVLGDLATRPQVRLDDKIAKLLDIGCTRFELPVGVVSRVNKGRYEIVGIHAPEGFPVARGAVFSIEETYCGATLRSERPVAFESASQSSWAGDPNRSAFPFQSYLGAAIRARGNVYGTLSFGSLDSTHRFTATDKDLVNLMAQWLGGEIEAGDGVGEGAERLFAGTGVATRSRGWRSLRIPRGIDLNVVLRRMHKPLRDLAGPKIELQVNLAPDLRRAHAPRVPLETVIRSLVGAALDAMPDGGKLLLETANLELASGEPGVFPAVAPDRYVTLRVRDTGARVDADALSRAFDAGGEDAAEAAETGAGKRLSLRSVYRMLQRCGGDLSVEVEPGRGSTFTVFLARADATPTDGARPEPRAAASEPEPAPAAAAAPPGQ